MDISYSPAEIKKSKQEALQKIKQYLDAEDVEAQFEKRSGDYYSSEKFIVSWKANHHGMPSEKSIDKCDSFYQSYSGAKAIYASRSLFHEKQLQAYSSIERALIDVGLKLCPKAEKKSFFDKYATKYNNRLQVQTS